MEPLVFIPQLRPLVWGDRRLASLGKTLAEDQAYGESWEISGHRAAISVVAEGPLAGHTLADLCTRHAAEFYGPGGGPPVFPLLVKFLDAHDRLSVQVHPDDRRAQELSPGEGGKTEAWVILQAEPGSRIWAGLKPHVTPEILTQHLDAGTVVECLHRFEPKPGDCIFLPAGIVHAVGGGVLMAEVQQTSDATFRLFDWNRVQPDGTRRKLHRHESLACIHWQAGPIDPVKPVPLPAPSEGNRAERLVSCPFFTLDRLFLKESLPWPTSGRVELLLVLHGQVRLRTTAYERTCTTGETLAIPASTRALQVQPIEPATVLRVSVPAP